MRKKKKKLPGKPKKEPASDEKKTPKRNSEPDSTDSEDYGGMNMANFRRNLGCG